LSVEVGWQRRVAVLRLDPDAAARLIGQPVTEVQLLAGGLRNSNYRVQLGSGEAVLRIYTAEAAACDRETRLFALLRDSVPVPRLLEAKCDADPPFALVELVAGVRFDHQPPADLAAASFNAGHVLARIHAFPLEQASGVDLNRYSGAAFDFVEFIESTLRRGVLSHRLGPERTRLFRRMIREQRSRLAVQDTTLQHSDYKPWNLLVRDGKIAAVLDWEFAFAGPRLNDLANFLRYCERQPRAYRVEFERGYLAGGGTLPDDWFRLARLTDLMSLCEFLSRPDADPAIARDVVPLIERTIDLFSSS
jgi:aminoglycoside phosphotransferase (APT) family kinase protein